MRGKDLWVGESKYATAMDPTTHHANLRLVTYFPLPYSADSTPNDAFSPPLTCGPYSQWCIFLCLSPQNTRTPRDGGANYQFVYPWIRELAYISYCFHNYNHARIFYPSSISCLRAGGGSIFYHFDI